MKIWKFAAISLLILSSLAANGVTPSKTELEAMYDKAFREFDASNYEQALKDLDAIDARQPDVAESANLRGVILMRQKDYANAEKSLQKALAADAKFWNARFNLAEIPFLEKNWTEARKRFQELLNGNAAELQGEATQLIQYKVLITCLMEGKENMVQALVAKFKLSPDTPAVHYANAAIALHRQDETGARDALATAEKDFSPQLNKLFAESLYEVGWLEKPAGETRAALALNSATERAAATKALAEARFEEAEQALRQRDFTAARRLVEEAAAADPDQARVINLRGEIFLEQKEFDQAEREFEKASKLDSKFRDAHYNLAQIPFKKKDYAKARERFEALFSTTSGADKDRAAQLIKYKVYLTYLLEGKEAPAQKLMEQFQFTGDTPALYYAQAAWEFQHENPAKANDWVASARKIYSPALNSVFSDAFYDLGWIQSADAADSGAGAPTVLNAGAAQPEQAPSIEPTPIPATAIARDEPEKSAEPLEWLAQPGTAVPEVEETTSPPPAPSVDDPSSSPTVETPVASTASPAIAEPVIANDSEESSTSTENTIVPDSGFSPAPESAVPTAAGASVSPAPGLAPAQVRDRAQPTTGETIERFSSRNILLIGGVLLAAILVLGWVLMPELRRRMIRTSTTTGLAPAGGPSFDQSGAAEGTGEELVVPAGLAGGPPRISLQLRASEPALRRAMPPGSNGHSHTSGNGRTAGSANVPSENYVQPEPFVAPAPEAVEANAEEPAPNDIKKGVSLGQETGAEPVESAAEPFSEKAPAAAAEDPAVMMESTAPASENVAAFDAPTDPPPSAEVAELALVSAEEFFGRALKFIPAQPTTLRGEIDTTATTEAPQNEELLAFTSDRLTSREEPVWAEPIGRDEPIDQGQPIPALTPAVAEKESRIENAKITEPREGALEQPAPAASSGTTLAGTVTLRHFVETFSSAPKVGSSAQTAQQPTTPAIMPETTHPISAPVIHTSRNAPVTGGGTPQPARMQPAAASQLQPLPAGGGMQTAVELTFSFEIASLQLTPTFKMGGLQLRPNSKVVTMRLAPSQHAQPEMNLQVTFEIASVQLEGNAIGTIRLTPSQEQRPGVSGSARFNIAALQLVSGEESASAPVQITPSQQGQAAVQVTAPFEIATVEVSPSFEIAAIVLNANSSAVSVQLPGADQNAGEGGPLFEVSNVELAENGEIEMLQLNAQSAGSRQAG